MQIEYTTKLQFSDDIRLRRSQNFCTKNGQNYTESTERKLKVGK